jgi:hypothetical protein
VPRGLLGAAVLGGEGGPRLPGGLRGRAVVAGGRGRRRRFQLRYCGRTSDELGGPGGMRNRRLRI